MDDITATSLGPRFAVALVLATQVHGADMRKGTTIPYLSHPLAVASIALEFGADEDRAIAAVLHDVVEDGGGQRRLDEIRGQFGDEVARIVAALSDAMPVSRDEKAPWWERKSTYLEGLHQEDAAVALVCASDKLHNLRAIRTDHRVHGPALWGRFSTGRRGTLWYYGRLAEILPQRLTEGRGADLAACVREEYLALLEQIIDDPRECTSRVDLDAELAEGRSMEASALAGIDPEPAP
jgi:GTP pyrophosphokinase